MELAQSVNPDQTAPLGVVWSGVYTFYLGNILNYSG